MNMLLSILVIYKLCDMKNIKLFKTIENYESAKCGLPNKNISLVENEKSIQFRHENSIIATYYASSVDTTTRLVWSYNSGCGVKKMYVDDVEVKYSYTHKFDSIGEHTVKFIFECETDTTCEYMFQNCSGLTSIDLSNFNTHNVTNMSNMFSGCKKLKTFTAGKYFNTSNVTTMASMFYNCNVLSSIDLSNFNTSNVKSMKQMFTYCYSLTDLDLSKFKTFNLTDTSYMFSSCSGLTSINSIENLDMSKVTTTKYMFSYCFSLPSLDLNKWNVGNVVDMEYMFSGCVGLTSLNINKWDVRKVSNFKYTFENCNGLEALNLNGWNTIGATDMAGMFYRTVYYMSRTDSHLKSLDVSTFDTSNVTNMGGMFHGLDQLESLNVSNFNTSKVTNMNSMFGCLGKIKSLDVTNFDTSNVTGMNSMFEYCYSLQTIDLSNFNTRNVTTMAEMFNLCSGLLSLNLSNFNTSKVTSMNAMFANCGKLTELDLSNFDMTNVTNIGNMFHHDQYGTKNLKKLIILGDITNVTTYSSQQYQHPYNSGWIFSNVFGNLTTNGTFTCNHLCYDKWVNEIGVPSTWVVNTDYTPLECINLTISAEDVGCRATTTMITYTAMTNGTDTRNNQINNVEITGTVISSSFEQNSDPNNEVIRTITFEYLGVTASTTIKQSAYVRQEYSIDLNNQWRLSSAITNPDSSLYEGVYESYSNKSVNNSAALMYIDIDGYENFKFYVRSYAESSYDFVVVSNLDCTLTSGTTSGSNVKMTTSGKQNNGTAISNYTLVEFNDIDCNAHRITVMYRKDSSTSSGNDQGFLLIPINQ